MKKALLNAPSAGTRFIPLPPSKAARGTENILTGEIKKRRLIMPINESEERNLIQLRDMMLKVPAELAWRLANIVLEAVHIGEKGASEEYKQSLDKLIQG